MVLNQSSYSLVVHSLSSEGLPEPFIISFFISMGFVYFMHSQRIHTFTLIENDKSVWFHPKFWLRFQPKKLLTSELVLILIKTKEWEEPEKSYWWLQNLLGVLVSLQFPALPSVHPAVCVSLHSVFNSENPYRAHVQYKGCTQITFITVVKPNDGIWSILKLNTRVWTLVLIHLDINFYLLSKDSLLVPVITVFF